MNTTNDPVRTRMSMTSISQEQAVDAVRHWWTSWLMDRDLKRLGKILQCKFYNVPYWKIEATVHGSVDGCVTESDHTGYGTYSVKKWVKGNIIYTTIATNGSDIAIGYLKSDWSYEAPYDKPPVSALPVTLAKTAALSKGITAIENYAIKLTHIEEAVYPAIGVDVGEITLVYYPLWIVQYSYSGTQYSVIVDGNTGEVVAGRAPGNIILQAVSHIASICLGVFLVVFFIWLFFLNGYSDSTCLMNLGIGAMAIFLLKKTYDHHKYGSEVSQGYNKLTYGPLYDKDQAGREILFNDLKVTQ